MVLKDEILRLQKVINELLESEDIDYSALLEVSKKLDELILEFYKYKDENK